MALPKTLQPSLTPDELTFLAEEDAIDIVPLFSMTRVRLLSVRRSSVYVQRVRGLQHCPGHIRSLSAAFGQSRSHMACSISETETEVPHSSPRLARCR